MDPMKSALNIFRRLPPEDIENTYRSLTILREDLADELLENTDFPLKLGYDTEAKKNFIRSDFNCDRGCYRSPWTNQYFPPCEDGFAPSEDLRAMEEVANYLFRKYAETYYMKAETSVYLWSNDTHICGCFLLYKEVPEEAKLGVVGSWHSLHLIEVIPEEQNKKAEYRLTTTIQLYMTIKNAVVGEVTQNGSLTRQVSNVLEYSTDDDHVTNIGTMIEQMENFIRNNFDSLYMSKNQETVNRIRNLHPSDLPQRSMLAELSKHLKKIE